jgi:hypothetical protein
MKFMIRLSTEPTYFTDLREGKVFETLHPTYGRQMSFETANEAAAYLRSLGFEAATVVDQWGVLPSAEDLVVAKNERVSLESRPQESAATPPKNVSVLAQFSDGFVRYEDNRGETILIPLPA